MHTRPPTTNTIWEYVATCTHMCRRIDARAFSSAWRLEVPRPAKTGPLRPTNPPEEGRIYFMLFSNPGVVKAGDEVTVQIGDFEAEVVVE